MDAEAGFASVYDIIYAEPGAFLDAQVAFLIDCFAATPGLLLDAGCGTGRHAPALAEQGRQVVGLDASAAMLAVARARPAAAWQRSPLLRGDLRALPLRGASCSGILCLESPLAYLLKDDDLAAAVQGLWRTLRPGGRIVVDVFDYPATLGPDGIEPQTHVYPAPWGSVGVTESHRCNPAGGVWRMQQAFTVRRAGGRERFTIEHRLSLRPAEEYAAALYEAGFEVRRFLTGYPGVPREVVHERRMIFIADRS